MPYLHESLAKQKELAEAPTLGNLHPDARAQAIARAALADGERMAGRLAWLHSPASHNVDGYEWGIFRVKWENGRAVEVWQTNADFTDLDAAMGARGVPGTDKPVTDDDDDLCREPGCTELPITPVHAWCKKHDRKGGFPYA